MKLPPWDHARQQWDRYRAFHIELSGRYLQTCWATPHIVMFDTGELIIERGFTRPRWRHEYSELGITIVATNDKGCPRFTTPEGEPVAKAWLNVDGQQYLLIDHDTKHVVQLEWTTNEYWFQQLPERWIDRHQSKAYAKVAAYFAGPGRPPVGRPIALRLPVRLLSKAEREHIDTITTTALAAIALSNHPANQATIPANNGNYSYNRAMVQRQPTPQDLLAVSRWDELDEETLRGLKFKGVARQKKEVPYLLLA